jgi:hypothetical protein
MAGDPSASLGTTTEAKAAAAKERLAAMASALSDAAVTAT